MLKYNECDIYYTYPSKHPVSYKTLCMPYNMRLLSIQSILLSLLSIRLVLHHHEHIDKKKLLSLYTYLIYKCHHRHNHHPVQMKSD